MGGLAPFAAVGKRCLSPLPQQGSQGPSAPRGADVARRSVACVGPCQAVGWHAPGSRPATPVALRAWGAVRAGRASCLARRSGCLAAQAGVCRPLRTAQGKFLGGRKGENRGSQHRSCTRRRRGPAPYTPPEKPVTPGPAGTARENNSPSRFPEGPHRPKLRKAGPGTRDWGLGTALRRPFRIPNSGVVPHDVGNDSKRGTARPGGGARRRAARCHSEPRFIGVRNLAVVCWPWERPTAERLHGEIPRRG
jgi:hypothetical protein